MSVYAPTESEIRDTFLSKFDELSETRTEDRHPAPEFWQWLAHEGWGVVGTDSLAFADEAFDLWERANATEATVGRWISDRAERSISDRTGRSENLYDLIAQVIEDALRDLDWMIRKHVVQPVRIAA